MCHQCFALFVFLLFCLTAEISLFPQLSLIVLHTPWTQRSQAPQFQGIWTHLKLFTPAQLWTGLWSCPKFGEYKISKPGTSGPTQLWETKEPRQMTKFWCCYPIITIFFLFLCLGSKSWRVGTQNTFESESWSTFPPTKLLLNSDYFMIFSDLFIYLFNNSPMH